MITPRPMPPLAFAWRLSHASVIGLVDVEKLSRFDAPFGGLPILAISGVIIRDQSVNLHDLCIFGGRGVPPNTPTALVSRVFPT